MRVGWSPFESPGELGMHGEMTLEDTLSGWTGPSSPTEQDKQERTVRMVKAAVDNHPLFADCRISVYAKGSYASGTNVRVDSDVDIVVQCSEAYHWDAHPGASHTPVTPYSGIWTPDRLRSEVVKALQVQFPGQVDTSGTTAIGVHSSSARVEADVVPSFDYHYFFSDGSSRNGTLTVRTTGERVANYLQQHLDNGILKDGATYGNFKKNVRILKRLENQMVEANVHREVPSYFVECLAYNCPDDTFMRATWTDIVKTFCGYVWGNLDGPEPRDESSRWLEVNRCKYLFSDSQKWTRQDGRDFAFAIWSHLGLNN